MNMSMLSNVIVNGVDLAEVNGTVIYRPELNRPFEAFRPFENPVLVYFWSEPDMAWIIYWGKKGDNPVWKFPLTQSVREQVFGDMHSSYLYAY